MHVLSFNLHHTYRYKILQILRFFYRKAWRQSPQNRMGFTRKTSFDTFWKPTFQCSNSIHNQTPQKHVWQKRPFYLWKSTFNPHISTWGKSAVCLQNVQLIVYIHFVCRLLWECVPHQSLQKDAGSLWFVKIGLIFITNSC